MTDGGLSVRELADRHSGALLAYVSHLVDGDSGTAEDVVQETLIRAWQHPEAFLPGRGSARGWLFTVARNLAMDSHRRRGRRSEVCDRRLDGGIAADWIEPILDRCELNAALRELTPEHRGAIVEVFLREHPVDDAARRLGVPSGTVKSRCYYALRRLATILRARGFGPASATS
ncbi:sigma-70 family RNA polymerase sigma factor [Krasilnikovia sp. MM14-A1004]|uniref:sigma-70 family RNA polymerase sigma factor n=1 Tax=Krasilnikovia sp. MM14-A1004 TaxID=3373541 RepID=UPI00399D3061